MNTRTSSAAAPGGPGFGIEKQTRDADGVEYDARLERVGLAERLDFGPGDDAYSLASTYAEQPANAPLAILVWVGTDDFNYLATLEYLDYLSNLSLSAERLIVPDIGHEPFAMFGACGEDILRFFDRHLRR